MIISPVEDGSDPSLSKSASKLNLSPPPVHPAIQYKGTAVSPPGYAETRTTRPTTTVTYTFAPQTIPANSMILESPSYVESVQSSYYISVNMNCFTPSSYITTVRRRSWDGEIVGDFELGLSRKTATVCIRGNELPMNELLESGYRIFRNNHQTWSWKITEHDKNIYLYWEETPDGLSCYSAKDKIAASLLAKFIPPKHLRKQGRLHDSTRLEVTSNGHSYLDDIVISVLAIERLRTSPSVWPLSL